jgi:hypothetical protein
MGVPPRRTRLRLRTRAELRRVIATLDGFVPEWRRDRAWKMDVARLTYPSSPEDCDQPRRSPALAGPCRGPPRRAPCPRTAGLGELEGVYAVGLKSERLPDPCHRHVAHARRFGQRARRPVRGVLGRRLQRIGDDALHFAVVDAARPPGPRLVAQAVETVLQEVQSPLPHRGRAAPPEGGRTPRSREEDLRQAALTFCPSVVHRRNSCICARGPVGDPTRDPKVAGRAQVVV